MPPEAAHPSGIHGRGESSSSSTATPPEAAYPCGTCWPNRRTSVESIDGRVQVSVCAGGVFFVCYDESDGRVPLFVLAC
ncbi:hypothetical protein EJB05_30575 [Eragrostis curvula]|uniref:Uncharacterized protein n=1 Tax=Eragrostis curvula TaxID=38414 RepID=A0A5J9UCW3_9POAL|nr:hypothetical protein EJB05_30575 [Eragrostis curvula]